MKGRATRADLCLPSSLSLRSSLFDPSDCRGGSQEKIRPRSLKIGARSLRLTCRESQLSIYSLAATRSVKRTSAPISFTVGVGEKSVSYQNVKKCAILLLVDTECTTIYFLQVFGHPDVRGRRANDIKSPAWLRLQCMLDAAKNLSSPFHATIERTSKRFRPVRRRYPPTSPSLPLTFSPRPR